MSDLGQHINRINEKLQKLLKGYHQLQKENERQALLIEELSEAKKKNIQQVTLLQEQLGIIKAATGRMDEADKKAFEKTISHYIREIDKCIGLLSE